MLFKISDLGSDNGRTDGVASTHGARSGIVGNMGKG